MIHLWPDIFLNECEIIKKINVSNEKIENSTILSNDRLRYDIAKTDSLKKTCKTTP